MASTHFLLHFNFNSNPLLQQNFGYDRNTIALKRKYYYPCCIEVSAKFNMRCFIMRNKNKNGVTWRSMENVVKASVISGVLVVLYDHHRHALAASGGKMSGQESSSSSDETYNTQTSSPASSYPDRTRNPVRYYAQLVFALTIVAFPLVLMSYPIINILIPAQTSVLKLQVGLLGTYRSLQRDLKRIAAAAASTSKGTSYALQEATLALLRHPEYCISGYSSLTIIVVVDGVSKLPHIRSSAQLKNALQMLASIPSRDIKEVKMFWDPQQENNFLTAQELLEDYVLLNPI